MTTFQVIVYSVAQGLCELLPVSAAAHRMALSYFTGWPQPSGVLLGTLYLGSTLALLTYFVHDWASMLSCTLQLVIYRKRPMTLDERMPLFLMLATLPAITAWYYGADEVAALFSDSYAPLLLAGSLALFTLPLLWVDGWSRKNRGMFDWSIKDSLAVGLVQSLAVIPGCGRTHATLVGGLLRNFTRESAAKFSFFAALPVLALASGYHLRDLSFSTGEPMPELSWMSLVVSLIISYLASLLALGGFTRYVARGNGTMGRYGAYRLALALGIALTYFYRAHYSTQG